MDKALIKRHNFEVSKKNIETFSNSLPSNPAFDRVEVDGGLFGLGDHKVTGNEMNNFIGKVQYKLIAVNTSLRSIISEFREVYEAFDYLDREYIDGIIGSIESAEEASKQALKAQSDIQNTVENLKKTVLGLVNLKNSVEKIERTINTLSANQLSYDDVAKKLDENYKIGQIDSVISSNEGLKSEIKQISDNLVLILLELNKLKDLHQIVQAQNTRNETLENLYKNITSKAHYNDIDAIWNDVESHKANLADFHQQVDSFIEMANQTKSRINNDIAALQQYRTLLETYQHLGDIDAIWNDVEGHKASITELQDQMSHFISDVHTTTKEIKESINNLEKANTDAHLQYERKIKTAYYISGSAIGLSFINYLLQILGII